ncbi:ArsA family ATPase [Streptomyces tendae]|uniref:ArsA family ATPase n=1 Tax=Streptomyces tendae TaxID=1932 RepID=UPI00381B5ED2
MRTLLITGPGGTGRTTVAAATALTAAREGTRTLLLGTDRDDTLGAVLGLRTGPAPTPVEPGLTVWRPDAAQGFRDGLAALQDRAASALDLLGASRLDPEDLTPLPGAEDLALLRALREAALAEAHDLLVVDLPPVPRALALLAAPEELRRCLRRLLPPERQAARALRPVLGRLAGVPMPAEALYEATARWDLELAAAEAVLADRHTAVRLVAEPGPAGADAVRAAALGLALRGLRTDLLVANRVLPEDAPADSWLSGPLAQQRKTLEEWRGAHDVRAVAHLGRDPRGTDDLAALDVPGVNADASPVEWPVTDRLAEDGVLVWHIPLPGAVREDLDLIRRGDELVVAAGPFRRVVPLPSVLRRCTVDGAALRDGALAVRFAPDPELWPRGR